VGDYMKRIVVFLIVVLANSNYSQTYTDFAGEIFFGRLPSSKSEAMGRILALNFDPYFISQSNPAILINTNGIAVFFANSSPLYGYSDATYNYAGVSYNHPAVGAFAFNFLRFIYGVSFIITGEGGPQVIGTYEPSIDLYTLTYSNEFKDWFAFGINANLFVANNNDSYTSSFFELGLSRNFILTKNSQVKDEISVGTQLKNIFNQSFEGINQSQADVFPMIFRIGLSNSIEYTDNEIYDKSYLIGFLLGLEYQDLFNSRFRTAYKAGAEISVIDIVFLRGGYYQETKIDYGINSKDKLEEFTYGFGLKLDFDRRFTSKFPLVLLFDFVSLKQPSYTIDFDDWDNFTTFTLIANYGLD
jgi:hypothetical protein